MFRVEWYLYFGSWSYCGGRWPLAIGVLHSIQNSEINDTFAKWAPPLSLSLALIQSFLQLFDANNYRSPLSLSRRYFSCGIKQRRRGFAGDVLMQYINIMLEMPRRRRRERIAPVAKRVFRALSVWRTRFINIYFSQRLSTTFERRRHGFRGLGDSESN